MDTQTRDLYRRADALFWAGKTRAYGIAIGQALYPTPAHPVLFAQRSWAALNAGRLAGARVVVVTRRPATS